MGGAGAEGWGEGGALSHMLLCGSSDAGKMGLRPVITHLLNAWNAEQSAVCVSFICFCCCYTSALSSVWVQDRCPLRCPCPWENDYTFQKKRWRLLKYRQMGMASGRQLHSDTFILQLRESHRDSHTHTPEIRAGPPSPRATFWTLQHVLTLCRVKGNFLANLPLDLGIMVT